MLPFLVLNAAVCLIAAVRFRRRFSPNSAFTWNALLGSLAFLALWTPVSVLNVFIYAGKLPSAEAFWVINMQATLYLAAAAPIVTISIRLSYKPIRTAITLSLVSRSNSQSAYPLLSLA